MGTNELIIYKKNGYIKEIQVKNDSSNLRDQLTVRRGNSRNDYSGYNPRHNILELFNYIVCIPIRCKKNGTWYLL